MTPCIESCIGEVGGADGIEPEQRVLITEHGPESMSQSPFEAS